VLDVDFLCGVGIFLEGNERSADYATVEIQLPSKNRERERERGGERERESERGGRERKTL
jgi:hypothetical protein